MIIETLKTLCALNGVSGDEGEVRDYIAARCDLYADEIITDVMGNLLILKKGSEQCKKNIKSKNIMLCAHMDEVGIIITRITDGGYLKFAFVGGVDRRVTIGKRVSIGRDKIPGIIGIKAHHLLKKDEEKSVPKTDALYIDIGARDKHEAENIIKLGDAGVLDGDFLRFGEDRIRARAIDDRVGCAMLLELMERDWPADIWFAFTAQEEVGARGAIAAANRLKPDIALILEATTAADIPGADEGKKICFLGEGPVIPFMDGGAVYDKTLYDKLSRTAEKNAIPWQTKKYIAGGTDAAAIQRSGIGVRTAAVSVPIRNIHTSACVADFSDIENSMKLAALFLGGLDD